MPPGDGERSPRARKAGPRQTEVQPLRGDGRGQRELERAAFSGRRELLAGERSRERWAEALYAETAPQSCGRSRASGGYWPASGPSSSLSPAERLCLRHQGTRRVGGPPGSREVTLAGLSAPGSRARWALLPSSRRWRTPPPATPGHVPEPSVQERNFDLSLSGLTAVFS